jgi:hypothetical protein
MHAMRPAAACGCRHATMHHARSAVMSRSSSSKAAPSLPVAPHLHWMAGKEGEHLTHHSSSGLGGAILDGHPSTSAFADLAAL